MSHKTAEIGKDPNNVGQHEAGAKLDAGKIRASLVLGGFPKALLAVGEVGTFGANKYSPDGWKTVIDGESRYKDAMLRHYLKSQAGEEVDEDSDLLHLAHLAWNALAVLELHLASKTVVPTEPEVEGFHPNSP